MNFSFGSIKYLFKSDHISFFLQVIIPLDSSILDHPERPQSLSVTIPQVALSNTRHCPHGSRVDLASACDKFTRRVFFQALAAPGGHSYPRDRSAFDAVPAVFLQHAVEMEPRPLDAKRLRSHDVWSLGLSRLSLGFDGARRLPKGRTQPFVEPFALSVWMCRPNGSAFPSSPSGPAPPQQLASVHFIVHTVTPVKMWLNHYQYVALLRMKDAMARLGAELSRDLRDSKSSGGREATPTTVCLALVAESSEVGLLLPAACSELEEEVPHTPETDTPSMSDSDVSPVHRPLDVDVDVVVEEGGLENGVSTESAAFRLDEQDALVEEACEAVEEGPDGLEGPRGDTATVLPTHTPGHSPALSREPSTFSLEGELSSAINVTKDVTKDAISASLDLTKGALSITKDAFSMLSRGSGMSKLFGSQAK